MTHYARNKERLQVIGASLSQTIERLDELIDILEDEAGEYQTDELSDLRLMRDDLEKVADTYSHRVPTGKRK